MFGFTRRRIKLGRVKSHLSDATHATRSPVRQTKRPNHSAGESAGHENTNPDDPNCPSSSSSGADANVSTAASPENWMVLSILGEKPPPRFNHAAAVVGSKMFVVGGETTRGLLLEDVQVLNFDKLNWSAASPKYYLSPSTLPLKIPACKGHCLVSWGQKLLLIGGKTNPPSERITMWAFNVETECWTHVEAKGDVPVARSGHTVTRAGTVLILFGGEDGKGRKLNDLHMFDLKSLTWLPLHCTGTGPSPRSNHVAALYDDRVLMIFGGASKSRILNDLYSLDFETMAWSRVKTRGSHPTPRAGSCGVLSGSKWYIIGGGSRKKRHAETIIFDVLKIEWTTYVVSTSSSVITNKGFSLVQMMHKERPFLIAFGGTKKDSSNQVEVLITNNNDDLHAVTDKDPLFLKKSSVSGRDFASHLNNRASASSVSSARITDGVEHHGSGRRSLSGSSLDPTSNVSLHKKFLHEEGPPSARKMRNILEDDTSKDTTDVHVANTVKSKVKEPRSMPLDVGVQTDITLGADNTISFQKRLNTNDIYANDIVHLEPDQTKLVKTPGNIYQHYEEKIQMLEKKNSLLEDQLATAFANQDIAEKDLSSAVRNRQEAEKRLGETMKETELLRDKLATVEMAQEEANALSNIVHSDNVRLEHDVAFLKAILDDTQKELHSTRGVLAGERARAFQLQVEVFHLKQRLQAVDNRAPTPRKPFHA